jgi:hypothetical protein
MSIELTVDQSQALAAENGAAVTVVDPRTQRTYRLVPEDLYQRLQALAAYDDSPWTDEEKAVLAGLAFGEEDEEDYSHYLQEQS